MLSVKSSLEVFVIQTVLTSKVGHVAISVHMKLRENQVFSVKTCDH